MSHTTPHTEQPVISPVQTAIQIIILLGLSGVVLFGAAGRFDWPLAWVYFVFMAGFTFLSRLHVLRVNPDLIAERAASLNHANVKPWDRILMPFVAIWGPLLVLLVAGLDRRNGWSADVALWLQLAALGVVVLGYLLSHWAMLANRFFSGTVRIQHERNHTVINQGPYRFVRHPGYTGGVLANPAIVLVLGSLWALVPALLVITGLVVRTALEDRTLREELAGYADYARRVRYRLIPGVW